MTDVQAVATFIENWKQVNDTIDKFHHESAWDNMTQEQANVINAFRIKQSEMEDTYDFYSRQDEIMVSRLNNWLVEIANYNEFYNDNIKKLTAITEA
ncbi:unnamed protein product [Fructobacillus evanidus]|uniref:Uncharacterized protein n=1 Tax=Fructobacillus evanidus TaxID=3064281 RepID=A0ABM9MZM2_9LACO|nr:unnamed protein product [Fructobacillus sp. LMG 32999]CAK1251274.1 unnamed protein product [Fructobacillus sp. LMG 32999]